MKSNNFDLCSPRLLNFENQDLTSGRYLGIDHLGYPGLSEHPFYIEGCSLFVSKKAFDNLGGFDKAFFMYGENIDLSWRARIYGYKLGVCESLKLMHYGGGTSRSTSKKESVKYKIPLFRRYESEKNGIRMLIKNYSYIFLLFMLPQRIILTLLEGLYFIFNSKVREGLHIIDSLKWNLMNIRDTLKEKEIIEMNRKISDFEILKLMDKKFNKLVSFVNLGKIEIVK